MTHPGNGSIPHSAPCDDLRLVKEDMRGLGASVAAQRSSVHLMQTQIGEILVGVGEAAGHAKIAAREAGLARLAADKASARAYEQANTTLIKYDSNPPLDYGEGAGDITKTQDVRTVYRRAKVAERTRVYLALIAALAPLVAALSTWLLTRH